MSRSRAMTWKLAVAALILLPIGAAARAAPAPLYDPAFLNIGLVCRWDGRCIDKQKQAMKRALKYVKTSSPPTWRVHVCNRNASRGRDRTDWIGYDNCIRNAALRPPPPRAMKRRPRRLD
jgi:hypothetical protein